MIDYPLLAPLSLQRLDEAVPHYRLFLPRPPPFGASFLGCDFLPFEVDYTPAAAFTATVLVRHGGFSSFPLSFPLSPSLPLLCFLVGRSSGTNPLQISRVLSWTDSQDFPPSTVGPPLLS